MAIPLEQYIKESPIRDRRYEEELALRVEANEIKSAELSELVDNWAWKIRAVLKWAYNVE